MIKFALPLVLLTGAIAACTSLAPAPPPPAAAPVVAAAPAPPAPFFRHHRAARKHAEQPVAARRGQSLVTARAVLAGADDEPRGFGGYSYLLAGEVDRDSLMGQRLQAALEGYTQQPAYCGMAAYFKPEAVNLFLVPLRLSPGDAIEINQSKCGDRIFLAKLIDSKDAYNVERAVALMRSAGLTGKGPYLIASEYPLSSLSPDDRDKLLVWPLESADPKVITLAVNEFLRAGNSVAGFQEWNEFSWRRFGFRLINYVQVAARAAGMTEAAAKSLKDLGFPGK